MAIVDVVGFVEIVVVVDVDVNVEFVVLVGFVDVVVFVDETDEDFVAVATVAVVDVVVVADDDGVSFSKLIHSLLQPESAPCDVDRVFSKDMFLFRLTSASSAISATAACSLLQVLAAGVVETEVELEVVVLFDDVAVELDFDVGVGADSLEEELDDGATGSLSTRDRLTSSSSLSLIIYRNNTSMCWRDMNAQFKPWRFELLDTKVAYLCAITMINKQITMYEKKMKSCHTFRSSQRGYRFCRP